MYLVIHLTSAETSDYVFLVQGKVGKMLIISPRVIEGHRCILDLTVRENESRIIRGRRLGLIKSEKSS